MSQLTLRSFEPVDHQTVAFQGLDEHSVLYGLLQDALYFRVAVTHAPRQASHLLYVYLAEADEDGNDADDDEGEHLVHEEEIEESSKKHGQYAQGIGNGLGEKGHHGVDVELEPVQHVARMMLLLAVPLRAEDAVEHALLHTVLRFDAQEILHPDGRNIERKITENECTHQSHSPVDGTFGRPRGYINSIFHGRDLRQRYRHRGQSDECVEEGLQTVAMPRLPQPAEQGA